MLTLEPQLANTKITYNDTLLLMGSCFSDNVGALLQQAKFNVLYNPTGIVFDPLSVAAHLIDYATGKRYQSHELFQYDELWHSWLHHSSFSSPSHTQTLSSINQSICKGQDYLQSASYVFITLGTAFSYSLIKENSAVANCHKAPKEWFEKKLLSIANMVAVLQQSMDKVKAINPTIQFVFTVSPVKHIRDGIVENNQSKARLIEVVHALVASEKQCSYFPAYELVTDILRDYRFYASDLAHPTKQAIDFIFAHFCQTYFTPHTQQLVKEIQQIVLAQNHKVLHPSTAKHIQFFKQYFDKTIALQLVLPNLNWENELNYFKRVE